MWMWSTGINRNIVECKVIEFLYSTGARVTVLIETLWNVKQKKEFKPLEIVQGINRNIVECKGFTGLHFFTSVRVLIETLWNVKQHRQIACM